MPFSLAACHGVPVGAWRRAAAVVVLAVLAGCGEGGDDPSGGGARPAAARVRVVSQNLLHGIACPAETDGCALPARVALFARQLDAAGCPELVAVQEANERMVELLRSSLAGSCD